MVIADAKNSLAYMQYRLQRVAQRRRFQSLEQPEGGWPILLGISFPKSGTNLLRQVLAGFCHIAPFVDRSFDVFAAFNAETGREKSPEEALDFLTALNPGDIAAAHLLTWPAVVTHACSPDFIPYFIYRDPRDVVVSHVFYVTERAREHIHHPYYAKTLTTFDERLRTSILGRPDAEVLFPDIRARYEPYLGWLDRPEVLPLQFEAFIQARKAALGKVWEHFSARLVVDVAREEALAHLENSINPQKSPTFRSGKVGEWQKYFSPEHKALFKDVSGDLLIRLGYEKDHDW